jgi:hypothetical protein
LLEYSFFDVQAVVQLSVSSLLNTSTALCGILPVTRCHQTASPNGLSNSPRSSQCFSWLSYVRRHVIWGREPRSCLQLLRYAGFGVVRRTTNKWFILMMMIGLFIGTRPFPFVQRVRGKMTGIIDIDNHFGSCTTG